MAGVKRPSPPSPVTVARVDERMTIDERRRLDARRKLDDPFRPLKPGNKRRRRREGGEM
jgi:hypothetical protein